MRIMAASLGYPMLEHQACRRGSSDARKPRTAILGTRVAVLDRVDDAERWTWKLGRIAGIVIRVHATFVLLLAWIAASHLLAGHGAATTARGLVLVVGVFAIIVLHELGHALVARRFGCATLDITLYPIGGAAHLERMPERPAQELLVAAAGPAVNVVFAITIYAGLRLVGADTGDPMRLGGSLAVQLLWINVSLALFNLLPAFPMDGGRILRALLALVLPRSRATTMAVYVARTLAVGLGLLGLVFNALLLLIAVFVWIAAGHERAADRLARSVRGLLVGDAMIWEFETLAPETSLRSAAEQLAGGFQDDFAVVEDGRVLGLVTRADLVRGLANHRADAVVADIMRRRFPIAGADEPLQAVLERLPHDGSSLLVLHDDEPIGMLDRECVGDAIALEAAREPAVARRPVECAAA
jgi:Zn-dependent protease/CBS domain-containing protein